MNRFIIDASVAAKWWIPEIHSGAALAFLESDGLLIAPDLLPVELGSILWKKVLRGEITQDLGREILLGFGKTGLRIEPSEPLRDLAWTIATQLNRSFYDSIYLALAVVRKGVFVTADQRFYRALQSSPLAHYVRWIEDGPEPLRSNAY